MNYRELGRTGWKVSEISFGAWAIGGDWGKVSEEDAMTTLHSAIDQGINLIDTADVYGDGRSERLIGRLLKERPEQIYVATKLGRRLNPHVAEGYNRQNMNAFVERSLKNLGVDSLDLVQLHCPPNDVYYDPEVFAALDEMMVAGKIKHYGVSVEKVEQAIKSLEYPNVQSVQIIFNMFRLRPAGLFFKLAQAHKVGILARVPLASGLLTGKITKDTVFPTDDHRNYNRQGDSFDVGETFSGVTNFDQGLQAVEELQALVPSGMSMAQFALRWILMHDAVTCAIPGGKNPQQVADNVAAANQAALTDEQMHRISAIYDRYIREQVHQRW